MVTAVLLAVLALWVLHWFPWKMLLGRKLPRLAAYVLGVLAMELPLIVLHWGTIFVRDLVLMTLAGGTAVFLAWFVDWVLDRVRLSYELVELMERERDGESWMEDGADIG